MITNPMDRGLRVVSFNLNICFMLLIHLQECTCICVCMCICMCVYICMYIYIYIYIKSNFDLRKTVLNT